MLRRLNAVLALILVTGFVAFDEVHDLDALAHEIVRDQSAVALHGLLFRAHDSGRPLSRSREQIIDRGLEDAGLHVIRETADARRQGEMRRIRLWRAFTTERVTHPAVCYLGD